MNTFVAYNLYAELNPQEDLCGCGFVDGFKGNRAEKNYMLKDSVYCGLFTFKKPINEFYDEI